jgi:4-carboxymuconolactone decarboxylase
MKHVLRLLLIAVFLSSSALAERFPPISPEQLTPEQKAVADAIMSGQRKSMAGPFNVWLRSPALADPLQKVGSYVRFQSSLPAKLNEFAILITGRHWTADFEWAYHYPLAIKAGVEAKVLAALAEGKKPEGMDGDEALVYEFSTELHRDKAVSDATYQAALTRFGERGITDLIAVNGYYDIVCMTLNVAQVGRPEDADAPVLPRLKQ